ncbi:MAG: RusA family crossover junction endodeoxyribonuclease [Planctomycetaceae bacterium]
MRFELPFPPSCNRIWRNVGYRTLLSREGRAYREKVCAVLATNQPAIKPLAGPLSIDILIHPPDRRRRDLDNSLKALLDALQHGGAYQDDSQIICLSARKCPPVPGGLAIVHLEETDGCNLPAPSRCEACMPEV